MYKSWKFTTETSYLSYHLTLIAVFWGRIFHRSLGSTILHFETFEVHIILFCQSSRLAKILSNGTVNTTWSPVTQWRWRKYQYTYHVHRTASETLKIDNPLRFLTLTNLNFLDQCRILAFPSTLFFVGERLLNHTIANISVIDRDTCEYRCYLDHNCISVNFYFGEKGAKAHNCELNNSTSKEYDRDLVKAANYVYHGTKVPVVKCQSHYSLFFQFIRANIHVWKTPFYPSFVNKSLEKCWCRYLLKISTDKKQKSFECLKDSQLY